MRKGWKWLDLAGQTFGTWTALSYLGKSQWLCRCKCGAERKSKSKELRKGQHRTCDTCGIQSKTQLVEMVGYRSGRLVVLRRDPERHVRPYWICRCDCGKEKSIFGKHLRSGATKSCGCLSNDALVTRSSTRGGIVAAHRPEYGTWTTMIRRCEEHADYAGRGIKVCERWRESFADFLADMGPRPVGHSIERINNDGNYEPGNCRWATRADQARNTRRSRYVEADGKRMVIADWAAESGLAVGLIYERIGRGWSEADAVATPARHITRSPLYDATRPRRSGAGAQASA